VRRAELEPIGPGTPLLASARPEPDLAASGWIEEELVAAGAAASFTADAQPTDGHWQLRAGDRAPYRTRVLVRRPPADRFSGILLVEWLNVSAGADAAPDWTYLNDEILRRGHAWAGVSAQFAGIEGGAPAVGVGAARGLRDADPQRYGALSHPGDAFCLDLYSQVARALAGRVGSERTLAIGESQSACALTSYVNGVHQSAAVFDGFLIHSRPGGALPLTGVGVAASIVDAITGPPTRIRTDLDIPVLVVQTEGDLFAPLAYRRARQPNTDRLRTWEIAGSAHSDAFMVGAFEQFLGCALPVNHGQQAYVLRAALRHLVEWVCDGTPPPTASPLDVAGESFLRDRYGNVLGGVRTPVVDAPVEALSGLPVPGASPICALFGSSVPLTGVWADREAYLTSYARATEAAIGRGFLLADDRDAILAEARPDLVC
jgi:Alpha/beta hydrolase domain